MSDSNVDTPDAQEAHTSPTEEAAKLVGVRPDKAVVNFEVDPSMFTEEGLQTIVRQAGYQNIAHLLSLIETRDGVLGSAQLTLPRGEGVPVPTSILGATKLIEKHRAKALTVAKTVYIERGGPQVDHIFHTEYVDRPIREPSSYLPRTDYQKFLRQYNEDNYRCICGKQQCREDHPIHY